MNREDVKLVWTETIELLCKLYREEHELAQRAYDPGAGYPSNTLGGRGTGPTISVEGETVPVTVVEAQVFANQRPDPVAVSLATIHQQLLNIRNSATEAHNAWARVSTRNVGVISEPDEIWCRSCIRASHFNPRFRGSLCRFCYDWLNQPEHHHELPPVGLLETRARGVRITSAVLARFTEKTA